MPAALGYAPGNRGEPAIFSKKTKGAAKAAPIAAHYRDGGFPVKKKAGNQGEMGRSVSPNLQTSPDRCAVEHKNDDYWWQAEKHPCGAQSELAKR
jgi:hypothetical protein